MFFKSWNCDMLPLHVLTYIHTFTLTVPRLFPVLISAPATCNTGVWTAVMRMRIKLLYSFKLKMKIDVSSL